MPKPVMTKAQKAEKVLSDMLGKNLYLVRTLSSSELATRIQIPKKIKSIPSTVFPPNFRTLSQRGVMFQFKKGRSCLAT